MQKENLIQISGTVETIIYKNEETGFTVLELDHDGEPLTVVGELSSVGEGEVLTLQQTLWQGMNKLLPRLASLE